MRTTIDRAGRVVAPKALRQAFGREPGAEIELSASEGRIELEPLEVRLERRGGLLVAVPTRPTPALSAALVDRTASSLRTTRKASRSRHPGHNFLR